jgi:hypothetical protein
MEPLPPQAWSGRGGSALSSMEDGPVAGRDQRIVSSRFAVARVRPAHRDGLRTETRPVEWLLIEWPANETEPTEYWLSTVPEDVDLAEIVALAKIRWRVVRDYQELKDELGLDHFEGRGWRGFHHHGILCMAAYCFLAAERGRLSPLRLLPTSSPLRYPEVSRRGAPPCGPKDITPFPSRASAWSSPVPSSPGCRTVPPAGPTEVGIYDTVGFIPLMLDVSARVAVRPHGVTALY